MNPYQPPYPVQPGAPGYGPQGAAPGYGPQGAPGHGPQGYGQAQRYPVESLLSVAKPTIALLGARAALPALSRALSFAGPGLTVWKVLDGLESLLGVAAIIAFFIWFARAYAWARATRGPTAYSTGLAIGGWFIPFANFVLPYLAMRDLWKRGMNDVNGHLVPLWWAAYLVSTALTIFYSMLRTSPQLGSMLGSSPAIWELLGWVSVVSEIGAYGLWAHLVATLTKQASRG